MVSLRTIGVIVALTSIVILALAIRLQPLKYGLYLYEYDPFFMYYTTKYLVEHGPFSWLELTKEHVKNFWYPTGRDVWNTEYPGVPYIGYLSYTIVKPLLPNIDGEYLLLVIANVLPPIFGTITVIFAFLIGRELVDEKVGLLSALFTAVVPAAVDRTIAGFYTKLGFGVAFFIVSLYFTIKSLKAGTLKWNILYSIVGGIFLGLVGFTWGGVSFAILAYAAYLIFSVFIGLNDRSQARTFTILFLTAMVIYVLTPKLGTSFIFSAVGVLAMVSLMLSYFDLFLKRLEFKLIDRALITLGIVVLLIAGLGALVVLGLKGIPTRQLSIIFPWIREENVIFVSVAEHHPPSWDQLFLSLNITFLFIPFSVLLIFLKYRRKETFLVLIPAIGAIYGTSSAAYLMNLAGPLASIMAAIGLGELLKTMGRELSKREPRKGRKFKRYVRIDPIPIMGVILVIVIVASATIANSARSGDQIPTILASGIPYKVVNKAWIKALEYLRENVSSNAVVVAWWDYGYWITVVGNKTSLCDNATINGTQISIVGRALLSDELTAAKIMIEQLKTPINNTYVMAYEAFYVQGDRMVLLGVADVAKSYWMIRIGGLNVSEYFDLSRGVVRWDAEKPRSALLYKVIMNSALAVAKSQGWIPNFPIVEEPTIFYPQYIAAEESRGIIVVVGIYKLNATAFQQMVLKSSS